MKPWWEIYPERFQFELDALRQEGIPFEIDKEALERGACILYVTISVGQFTNLRLKVAFPAMYPKMRFEISSEDLDLHHHQNPFTKSLCLIGRATENWDTSDYVAKYLKERLPVVIEAGLSSEMETVAEMEERQGEPITDYYFYAENSIILIDSDWAIDPSVQRGVLEIGLNEAVGKVFRGAVLSVQDISRHALAQADAAIYGAYPDKIIGRWYRLDAPPRLSDWNDIYQEIVKRDASFRIPQWENARGTKISVTGILFPEETRWRQNGDGWLFIVHVEQQTNKKGQPKRGISLVRPGRAGRTDFLERNPSLRGIEGKKVAVFGLGCLGAPSVLEFARCGIGELRILDYDVVDPATVVRWPFGLKMAGGKLKTHALACFLADNYPFTKVIPINHYMGDTQNPDMEAKILDVMLDGIDLIYDATAEIGIQHVLSELAAERKIPYMMVSATDGVWGGRVVRISPGRTQGCWMCYMKLLADECIRSPLFDPAGKVLPVGCAAPTFTGTNFDAGEIVLAGVRMAISTLMEKIDGGYPQISWDVAVANLRNSEGNIIAPDWKTYEIEKHPDCCGKRE